MKEKNLLQTNFKSKIALITFANVLIIFGLVYLVILPSINNLQENKMIVIDRKNELEAKSFQIEDIKSYFEERRNVEPKLSMLNNILLNQEKSLNFINDLEQIALHHNVSDKINLLQSKSEETGLYNKIPIVFTIEGKLPGLMGYLLDLETLDYYINIGSLELSQDSIFDSEEGDIITMRILASTYWEK